MIKNPDRASIEKNNRLSFSDCGEKLSKEEMQDALMQMLCAFADFCDEHGLRYYLSGGTLLGAVRHKGFIPWDDDIDVNMPRPDVEKLYQICQGRIGDYVMMPPDDGRYMNCCESFRLYNNNIIIESFVGGTAKKHPRYYPMFLDIFPIEGLPDSDLQTRLHYSHVVFLRKMMRVSSLKHLEGSNAAAHIFHIAAMLPAKLVGYSRWSEMLQKTVCAYSFDRSRFVGVMTAPVHTTEEKMVKEDYLPAVAVQFEERAFHAPQNYDTYLSRLYGDYMSLPPAEKQKSHHDFNIYWRKQ